MVDDNFYYQFRIEVIQLVEHLSSVFSDYFSGIFEITVDYKEPQAGYIKEPNEEFDETLLSANLEFLNKKMGEIAEKLNKLNAPWF